VADLVDAHTVVFRGASANLRYVTGIAIGADTFGFVGDRSTDTVQQVRRDDCPDGLGVSRANDQGDLLGYCFVAPDFHLEAWLRHGDIFTPLAVPGAGHVSPLGINNLGWVAGIWQVAPGDLSHGFVAEPQDDGFLYTLYDVPGAYATQLSGINDRGEIAGNYSDGDATTRTHGPIFRLASLGAEPQVFDPGEGYVAVSWGIADNGWIHGYIESAQTTDEHEHEH
jgi:hypothetical protein